MTSNPKDNHPFAADRPIQSKSADLLGRADFANRLGEAVAKWREKDSLVLAVYGKWGDGKSSVKNMVLELLQSHPKDSRPSVVEFNPWQWADQNQLMTAFFHEIYLVLGKKDASKEAKEAAAKWKKYGAYLQLGSVLLQPITAFTDWFFGLTGFASLLVSFLLPDWIPGALRVLGALSLLALVITKFLEKVAGPMSKLAELRELESKKTLAELKKEVSDSLGALSNPIVVVVDDVDRLNKSEVGTLFQLIKANADFPNLIYMLFFQRDIVEKSVEEPGIYSGSDYIEKIVQVGFNLPQVQQTRVHSVLFAALDRIIESEALQRNFEDSRWQDIFIPGLGKYFNNLRDVNRFLSTLTFHIGLLKQDSTFQVNPIDLIALEVLRQFEPSVYEAIFANREVFTGNPPSSGRSGDATKEQVKGIVQAAVNQDALKAVLLKLFPNIRWCFENYHSSVDEDDYRKLRVCHPNVFDRYFVLHLPSGELSQADIDKALSLAGNREGLKLHFLDLQRRGLLSTFLDRFEAYKQEVKWEYAVPFITAIFDVGDIVSSEHPGFFGISDSMHARRIIHWFLKTEDDKAKRKIALLAALGQTTGTYLPVDWISSEIRRSEKSPDEYNFEPDDLDNLKGIAKQLVRRAVDSGELARSIHLVGLLHDWSALEGDGTVRTWVEQQTKSDDVLMDFLARFVGKTYSHGMGSYAVTVKTRIQKKAIEIFFDIESVYQRLKNINPKELTDPRQTAHTAFMEMYDRFKNPEKYRDRWDD